MTMSLATSSARSVGGETGNWMPQKRSFIASSLASNWFEEFGLKDMGNTLRNVIPPRKRGLVVLEGYRVSGVFENGTAW